MSLFALHGARIDNMDEGARHALAQHGNPAWSSRHRKIIAHGLRLR
jgi:hypothetical protein